MMRSMRQRGSLQNAKRHTSPEVEEDKENTQADYNVSIAPTTPSKKRIKAVESRSVFDWQTSLLASPLSDAPITDDGWSSFSDSDSDVPTRRSNDRRQRSAKSLRAKKVNPYMPPEDPNAPKVPVKEFLRCGLYSRDLKVSASEARNARRVATEQMKRIETQSHSKGDKFRFEMPRYFGEFLLNTESDFKLPFDIWFQHEHALLRPIMEPEPYIKIKNNIIVDRKKNKDEYLPICVCTPQDACGENCLNRHMFVECIPQHCPAGAACTNQKFQKKEFLESKKLQVFFAGSRGFGLRCLEAIEKDTFIAEYRGEVISAEQCVERMETVYKEKKNYYFLGYADGEVLDAGQKGSEVRFVNHSCDPNCHIQKWRIDGEYGIGLYASRDIKAFEELLYDYNFEWYNSEKRQECFCGSTNCRGVITKKNAAEEKERERLEKQKLIKGKKGKRRITNTLQQDRSESNMARWIPLKKARSNYRHQNALKDILRIERSNVYLVRATKWCQLIIDRRRPVQTTNQRSSQKKQRTLAEIVESLQ